MRTDLRLYVERVTGIEPAWPAGRLVLKLIRARRRTPRQDGPRAGVATASATEPLRRRPPGDAEAAVRRPVEEPPALDGTVTEVLSRLAEAGQTAAPRF